MTEFQSLTVTFDGQTILENYSLTLKEGSHTLLAGPSGIGKTTLLRVAAGLLKPTSGSFIHNGKIAAMFQEPRLFPWHTALENVTAVLPKSPDSLSLSRTYLDAVGLSDAAEKYPAALSGGMAQRVSFARFLAYAKETDANLLLLDEPFSALDRETAKRMLSLLQAASEHKTLLLISHDTSVAEALDATVITL